MDSLVLGVMDGFNSTFSLVTEQIPTTIESMTMENVSHMRPSLALRGQIRIPMYVVIFVLSVVGNLLVIVTLAQNRRMRTVTNVFLLNLSVSDLLLAVFCMPFTLVPTLLRDFIFGKLMCTLIRYLQGVSVGVSVFTLVAISLERYFAICHPLESRRWQTLSHAYRSIALVWCVSLCAMIPIAVFQKLPRLKNGSHKCMEMWSSPIWEKTYTVFLDAILLVLPLVLMLLAYGRISATLWRGMQYERTAQEPNEAYERAAITDNLSCNGASSRSRVHIDCRYQMRHSNQEKSIRAKRRVIRMLFVVVIEFFVCWAPLYALQTWVIFDKSSALLHITSNTMSYVHLLSYVSACCNPITYCFMNRKFRQGFVAAFRCCRRKRDYAWRNSEVAGGISQRTGTTIGHTPSNLTSVRRFKSYIISLILVRH